MIKDLTVCVGEQGAWGDVFFGGHGRRGWRRSKDANKKRQGTSALPLYTHTMKAVTA
jgi:hypothetical protein